MWMILTVQTISHLPARASLPTLTPTKNQEMLLAAHASGRFGIRAGQE
jgi:hypothetical protein